MAFELEQRRHELAAIRVILHQQYPAGNLRVRALFYRNCYRLGGARQADPDDGTRSGLRFDLDLTAVPFRDAVHFRETKPRPHLAFCREERLEGALADFGRHADARVADLEIDVVFDDRGPDAECSARLHRIEGILDEVQQGFTELARDPADVRAGRQIALELNLSATSTLGPERP